MEIFLCVAYLFLFLEESLEGTLVGIDWVSWKVLDKNSSLNSKIGSLILLKSYTSFSNKVL